MLNLPTPDLNALAAAEQRQSRLTKPPGSLGRLEKLVLQLAAFQARPLPSARPAAALVFAADHPVTRHGVSPYPSAVTAAMLHNFREGGAAASVLARACRVPLCIVDVGVAGVSELPTSSLSKGAVLRSDPFGSPSSFEVNAPATAHSGVYVWRESVADSTAGDLRVEDAMSEAVFEGCAAAGRRAVTRLGPLDVLIVGEIGIGNTTAAAAVCAALLGGDPGELVGAGTGASGAMLETKRRVVTEAVQRVADERSPLEILRRLGGREIAAAFGAIHAALEQRSVVLVDGFVISAAALALVRANARALHGLVFSHLSGERGHARVLAELGVQPMLDLGLRLGEASGALAAYPLLEQACLLHSEMATFESAQVPDKA
ncbi:MAG TPA: nicotinate-nucleotide--dimethylbenzimidazole phosphoribosyltransferase [Polyangiaceae bacterium]|nr:nicotinate-nucleotide--dimethylbenzimidazole phosphoribosyltransferase [Polyangiaceae bacterium]